MIQFILKPKKEKFVLLLCLFVCMCGEHLVVFLQVSYYNSVFNSSCLIRGSCWEKIYKSTHRMESNKQTNCRRGRERYIWNITSLGKGVWSALHFYISSGGEWVFETALVCCVALCIFVQLGHVVKHLAPSDYSWCKNRTLLSLKQKKPTDY